MAWIEKVNKFEKLVREQFEAPDGSELDHFLKGCLVFRDITEFINITSIEEQDDCETKLEKFIDIVTALCDHGGKSFLRASSAGDAESFCLHCLRYCLPQIARRVCDDCGFGLGVFTMQGFEHRNKESKNVMRRRSNLKHNLTDQTIFWLCQHFKARIWDLDDKKKKKKGNTTMNRRAMTCRHFFKHGFVSHTQVE